MKETPDMRLQAAWQESAGRAPGCPTADEIWQALGSMEPRRVQEITDHTAACADCAMVWRLAHSAGAMEERDTKVVKLDLRARLRSAGSRQLAMAAGFLVAFGLGGYGGMHLFDNASEETPVYRTSESQPLESLVSEELPMPRSACRLAWTPGPAGTRYTVRVSTTDFTEVAIAEGIEETEYQVPVEALESFAPNTRLMWQVQAFLPEGAQVFSNTHYVTLE